MTSSALQGAATRTRSYERRPGFSSVVEDCSSRRMTHSRTDTQRPPKSWDNGASKAVSAQPYRRLSSRSVGGGVQRDVL
jgi:hypothetical protein